MVNIIRLEIRYCNIAICTSYKPFGKAMKDDTPRNLRVSENCIRCLAHLSRFDVQCCEQDP